MGLAPSPQAAAPELARAGVTGHQRDLGLSEGGPGSRCALPGPEAECRGARSSRPLSLGRGGRLAPLGVSLRAVVLLSMVLPG